MKINRVYINKEGAPMVSRNGWPTPINPNAEAWAQEEYLENLERAKRDAVPFESVCETFYYIDKALKKLADRTHNTFIDADIEVEFVQQMMNPDNKWTDCFGNSHNISWYTSLRWVARVVLAKEEIGNSCKHCGAKENQDCQHGGGECPWADEATSDNYLTASEKQDNGAHSFTEAAEVIYGEKTRCPAELFLEKYFGLPADFAVDAIVPEAQYFQLVNLLVMFRDEHLSAAQERVKELEHDKLLAKEGRKITNFPTKDHILNSLRDKWIADFGDVADETERNRYFFTGFMMKVLDELGIK